MYSPKLPRTFSVIIDMIVNYTKHGWEIITQRNHGLIASVLCAHWVPPFKDRWLETIIAVAEHDDAYNEFMNGDVLNEQGGPLNFNMRPFFHDFCESLLLMALSKSRYIALLVSYHIQFLYADKSKEAHRYCETLKPLQAAWLKEMGMSVEEGIKRYKLLQWCDALSLILCQQIIPPAGRRVDISIGPDHKNYELFEDSEGLCVAPWPFKEKRFSFDMEYRLLENLTFKDDLSFHQQLRQASTRTRTFIFKKTT